MEFDAGPSSICEEHPSSEPAIINLPPNESLGRNRTVPPIKIYVGANFYIKVKEYQKTLHIGLFKEEKVIKKDLIFRCDAIEKK